MNTPEQQAMLYRKAAETIEMCGPHGIEPSVKQDGTEYPIVSRMLHGEYACYEFPAAVIEGRLVWAVDVVYNRSGSGKSKHMQGCAPYTMQGGAPYTRFVWPKPNKDAD